MGRMNREITLFGMLFCCVLVFLPELVLAQGLDVTINDSLVCGAGGGSGESLFSHRSSDPTVSTLCDQDAGLFARIFCVVESTLGLIIGSTFCAIREAWLVPFGAMMMLFIVLTGASFLLGIINLTVKEVTLVIMKLALVTLFVTNADIALNTAYAYFVGIMQTTVRIMMEGFQTNHIAPAALTPLISATETTLDAATNTAQTALNTAVAGGNPFNTIDNQLDQIRELIIEGQAGELAPCSLFSGMMFLIVAFGPAQILLILFLITFIGFFCRAAYGYIYALVITTFLIAAMPIFVSFALFKATNDLFNHWLTYMGSNVIQIFIVFGIMAFASMVDFQTFLSNLDEMLVPYNLRFGPLTTLLTPISVGLSATGGPTIPVGIPVCSICEGRNIEYMQVFGTDIPRIVRPVCGQNTEPMTWNMLREDTEFHYLLMVNGTALFILTKVMDQFVKLGPDIAKTLGGTSLIYTIGGVSAFGKRGLDTAFHGATQEFEKGARKGAQKNKDAKVDPNKNFFQNIYDNSVFSRVQRTFSEGADAVMYEGLYQHGDMREAVDSYLGERQGVREEYVEALAVQEELAEKARHAMEDYYNGDNGEQAREAWISAEKAYQEQAESVRRWQIKIREGALEQYYYDRERAQNEADGVDLNAEHQINPNDPLTTSADYDD